MACSHPLLARNLGKINGKYKIKIFSRIDWSLLEAESHLHDDLMFLPCGCCAGCRMDHQKQFAVRCWLEAKDYKDNCMVTLTYDNDHLPKKLIKRDLQDFIKNARNHGYQFRYYGCGEYGSKGGRPHYHLIMFGIWPSDARFEFNSQKGFPVYSSKILSSFWKKGFVNISEVEPGTAAYVAGYVGKKLGQGEFCLSSKRPGIGAKYFREHLFDIYAYDNLVSGFGITKVPRYCDKIADQMFYDLEDIKDKRRKGSNFNMISQMVNFGFERKEEYFDHLEKINNDKLRKARRL